MFIGANGTSKTGTGANIVANIVFGPQSKWFEQPLYKHFPYIKKGRIISDPTTIKEKIIPELIKWLPRNTYKNFPEKMYETSKEGKYYASKFIVFIFSKFFFFTRKVFKSLCYFMSLTKFIY